MIDQDKMPTSKSIRATEYRARIGLHSNDSNGDARNTGLFQALPDVVASAIFSMLVAVDRTPVGVETKKRRSRAAAMTVIQ